jgi:purine-binding chemotaxis protein CheW
LSTTVSSATRFLALEVGDQRYGVAADLVEEVARLPKISRVPHAPPALLGLANIRGAVMPVLSLARLLGANDAGATRIVVVDAGEPLALTVSAVSEMTEAGAAGGLRKIDVAGLVAESLPALARTRSGNRAIVAPGRDVAAEDRIALLVFSVAGQDFALPLTAVDEVLALPHEVATMPHADAVVLGQAAVRGAVLPLLSLRALLALHGAASDAVARVVVVRIGSHRIGLVVDGLRSVLQVPEAAIDPVPHVLSRGGSEARIQAICRLDGGKRLVSVLAVDHLLRDDITARLLQGSAEDQETMPQPRATDAGDQFLLFRIGDDDFGLPIDAVEEIAPLPPKLARLPNAPAFVEGMINLRGEVIPVIDQARRFDSLTSERGKRRIVVVRVDDLRAGFIVDDVTEVARIPATALRAAPDLGGDADGDDDVRVFERVASFADDERIVLIVSPRELLSRAERDLLRGFGREGGAQSRTDTKKGSRKGVAGKP